ncbi:o-succinylbenzoate synthase [Belliella kenyensis]|uniref:O-succinylbenzoate synthase n=1 Tax=Belliella kenyensis TaxID=1472724 RepID=A0ABV8EI00_9BACT|nr:o-succinylbenzoate synthase [Belliella kenyensis]MCH7401792.1 o-succinylbenzoate synthase [Belliella kenyensis]MDN3604291.1 o-succinylbenzoate synthase [Belliella kenyensis]
MKNIQNLQFSYEKLTLDFKFEAGTSRGVLKHKDSYIIAVNEKIKKNTVGLGEAGPLPNLSLDDLVDFEMILSRVLDQLTKANISVNFEEIDELVKHFVPASLPSIRFGIETAILDLLHGGNRTIFPSDFVKGQQAIEINGLIWMGDKAFMLEQIDQKLQSGYNCIKMKIGAIDFVQECELLGYIRQHFGQEKITLRVDANGAFGSHEAMNKLDILSQFALHSIEQPIRQGQLEAMSELCKKSPLPIALDEELIGVHSLEDKRSLLESIMPQFVILKPTLLGGFASCNEWIGIAEELNIGWWMTSALESNIGLNAIAQYTAIKNNKLPQGLGTGQLYHNNIASPLEIVSGTLIYDPNTIWAK